MSGPGVITAAELLLLAAAPFAGSLVACAAWRIPRSMNWIAGRSCCDSCKAQLGAAELVPILSFAWQGGRCRHCRAAIPVLWLHAELSALAAAFLAIWLLPWPAAVSASLAVWTGIFLLVRHRQRPSRLGGW